MIDTIIIRFSARGAYLLLVSQGRALIRDRALISFFEKQPSVQNKILMRYLLEKETTIETVTNIL